MQCTHFATIAERSLKTDAKETKGGAYCVPLLTQARQASKFGKGKTQTEKTQKRHAVKTDFGCSQSGAALDRLFADWRTVPIEHCKAPIQFDQSWLQRALCFSAIL